MYDTLCMYVQTYVCRLIHTYLHIKGMRMEFCLFFFKKKNSVLKVINRFRFYVTTEFDVGIEISFAYFLGGGAVNATTLLKSRCFRQRFLFRKANWLQKPWYTLKGWKLFFSWIVFRLPCSWQLLDNSCEVIGPIRLRETHWLGQKGDKDVIYPRLEGKLWRSWLVASLTGINYE